MIKINKKIKNIFFDLDGTLLPMDMKEFESTYTNMLCEEFSYLGKELIGKTLYSGIKEMYANNGTVTNEEAFIRAFNRSGLNFYDYKEKFEEFYEKRFDSLKKVCKITPISKRIIDTLKNKGYTICIATNPLFPQVATYKRLSWLGIDPYEVTLVTTYENSRYTKPNSNYYIEILNKLNLSSNETIMFGNDVLEDGASSKVGIDTILVVDCLVNSLNLPCENFQKGTLEDVLEFCLSLEKNS